MEEKKNLIAPLARQMQETFKKLAEMITPISDEDYIKTKKLFYSYRYRNETPKNKYQIIVAKSITTQDNKQFLIPPETVTIDSGFCELLFSKEMRYETKEFLDFHYNEYTGNKNKYLIHTEQLIYDLGDKEHPIIRGAMEWLKEKLGIVKENSEPTPENILPAEKLKKLSHKIVLLWELGIIQYLQKEYKDLYTTNKVNFARLVGTIINETEKESVETIRKNITYIDTKDKKNPINPTSTQKVKTILTEYGIELKRLKD